MANRGTTQPIDEQAAACLRRGELFQPPTAFIERMALCMMSDQRFDEIVLDMCSLAKGKMGKKGANRRQLEGWLKKVAETLDSLQLRSFAWIEQHVAPLSRRPRVGPVPAESTACYRDIRLSTDPNLERRIEDAVTTEAPAASEDDLDLLGDDPMDIELMPPVDTMDTPVLEEPLIGSPAVSPSQRPDSQTVPSGRVSAKGPASVREDFIPVSRAKPKVSDRPSRSTRRTSPRKKSSRRSPSPVRHRSSPRRAARSPSVSAPMRRTSPRKRPHSQSTGPIPRKTVHVEEPRTTRVVTSAEPRRGGIVVEVPRGSGSTSRSRAPRVRHCVIPDCKEVGSYAKPHAFNHHLPRVFDERLPPAAIKVLRGRKEALLQAAVWLLRRAVDNLDDLVEYVEMQHLLTTSSEKLSFSDCQIVGMRAFCGYLSVPCPDNFTLEPVNSVAVLLHWKVLLLIAARIPATEREYWRTLFPAPEEVGTRTPRAFDAHFHLDRTLKAMGLRLDSTFQSVLDGTRMDKGKEVIVAGTCASFCDPETYPTTDSLKTLPADMEVAVGVHPKKRYSSSELDRVIRKLKDLVRQRRVTAVGEVGVDHSVPPEQWPQQLVMLEKILPLVEPRHVLVLHCRGMSGDSGAEAYLLLLHYVKKAVPEDQRIYLHCFNGDSYVREQWSSAFRNLYFGFTSMAAGFTPPQVRALKWINPERVLLETDAPYFNRSGRKWSAPNQLYWTAEAVAKHLSYTAESLLNATVTNAQRLFRH
ncbi:uncharacterized protein LOC117317969 [Pecten maximus]|uniref:uncharacterized protein LOC117317969 n=1 Tax=Pecten maximus TaxID=6579 RepID=UPI00145804DE|nr:uncharacterized protein LOC117317969 [Pecten maximus]